MTLSSEPTQPQGLLAALLPAGAGARLPGGAYSPAPAPLSQAKNRERRRRGLTQRGPAAASFIRTANRLQTVKRTKPPPV